MHYIVGLGNPGEQYERTRHNVGWLVLDVWRNAVGLPTLHQSSKYAGRVSEGVVAGREVVVLYPDTFMNQSGSAVAKLVPNAEVSQLVVVYDDVDLPLGEIKVSKGRGDGGHNGVKSIIAKLGTKDFVRVRVGICPRSFWTKEPKRPKGAKLPKYVLGKFTNRELKEVEQVTAKVGEVIETIVTDGVERAMERCN